MLNSKKWLAAILAASIALGDCGGMTAIATENVMNEETSVSDNTVVSDDLSPEEESAENTETPVEEGTKSDGADTDFSDSPAESGD